ncbi:MAG: BadF/BadG/BcrA/BcrD ATPase family protein [Acidimicrobiia bacterium]
MNDPTSIVGIDAGRSSCRAVLVDPEGRHALKSGPGIPAIAAEAVPAIVKILAATAAPCLASTPGVALSAGLAGLIQGAALAPAIAEGLARALGSRRILLTGDAVTGYTGALGTSPGVVVVAGTGAVALAAGPDGLAAGAGGSGHPLGDPGSGQWIGRMGLDLALRTGGARGEAAGALRELARQRYGALDGLLPRLREEANPARAIAAFARDVAEVARLGDRASRALWEGAARALAVMAATAARRAFLPGTSVVVSWSGGLFAASELLISPFVEEVQRLLPAARPTPPIGDPLEGAVLLAGLAGLLSQPQGAPGAPHHPLVGRYVQVFGPVPSLTPPTAPASH